jgi:dATP/dGTP diphosphohydrolase
MSGYVCPCGHADCGMNSVPLVSNDPTEAEAHEVLGPFIDAAMPLVSNDPTEIESRGSWISPNRAWNDEMNGVTKQDEEVISSLPTESAARKAVPLASGVLDYFPAALAEVARVSKAGNDKHNPGQPLHHARGKSTDHADALLRHLVERGKIDTETGMRHSGEVAWRALALLQQELEDEGLAPLPRGARL